jgi:hypothetical protein
MRGEYDRSPYDTQPAGSHLCPRASARACDIAPHAHRGPLGGRPPRRPSCDLR